MDAHRFDDLVKSFASRRRVLGGLGGALLGLVEIGVAAAKPKPPEPCQRKCGSCEVCDPKLGRCRSTCAANEICHGHVCVPACPANDCATFDPQLGYCVSTCLACEYCHRGVCTNGCSIGRCEQCDPTTQRCVATCGAGELCVGGQCTTQCDPCQTLDPKTGACTPACPYGGQVHDPTRDCACACLEGPDPCSGDAVCDGYSTIGVCCHAPQFAACCCESTPGAGDGWAGCCGGDVPCPTCAGFGASTVPVTECGTIGGSAFAGCRG